MKSHDQRPTSADTWAGAAGGRIARDLAAAAAAEHAERGTRQALADLVALEASSWLEVFGDSIEAAVTEFNAALGRPIVRVLRVDVTRPCLRATDASGAWWTVTPDYAATDVPPGLCITETRHSLRQVVHHFFVVDGGALALRVGGVACGPPRHAARLLIDPWFAALEIAERRVST